MWALLSYFTPSRESRSRLRFAPLQFSAIVAGKLPIPADMKEPSSDDWLPPGWKVEMKLTSTGRKYKVVFASTSLSHSRVSAQFVLIFVAFFLFFSSELWFQFFLLVFGWHFGNWFLELKFLCQFLLLVARNVLWENGEGVIELSDWVFEWKFVLVGAWFYEKKCELCVGFWLLDACRRNPFMNVS